MEIHEKVQVALLSRVFRATNKLTQAMLGQRCNVSQRVISYIEREEWERIQAETIEKVKKYLEIFTGLKATGE